jgi:hypothetical protein
LTPGPFIAPQLGQAPASAAPHSPQNFLPGSFGVPHAGQSTRVSLYVRRVSVPPR